MFLQLAIKLALLAISSVSTFERTPYPIPVDPAPPTTVVTSSTSLPPNGIIPPASASVTMTEDDPGWQCHTMGDSQCATVPANAPYIWQEECYLLIQGTAAGTGYLPLNLPTIYWNDCIDAGANLNV